MTTPLGPNECPAGSVAIVAMPRAAFWSALTNTSYLLRVKPGPYTATGHPPAGGAPAGRTSTKPRRSLPNGRGVCRDGTAGISPSVNPLTLSTPKDDDRYW